MGAGAAGYAFAEVPGRPGLGPFSRGCALDAEFWRHHLDGGNAAERIVRCAALVGR